MTFPVGCKNLKHMFYQKPIHLLLVLLLIFNRSIACMIVVEYYCHNVLCTNAFRGNTKSNGLFKKIPACVIMLLLNFSEIN